MEWEPFWVLEEELEPCTARPSCGLKGELGASCQAASNGRELGCCTVPAFGGHPAARCMYPPGVAAPSACVAQCAPGEAVLPTGCCRSDRVCGAACCTGGSVCIAGACGCPPARTCTGGRVCCAATKVCNGPSWAAWGRCVRRV